MWPLGEQLPHCVCMVRIRIGGRSFNHRACSSSTSSRLANTFLARNLYQSAGGLLTLTASLARTEISSLPRSSLTP